MRKAKNGKGLGWRPQKPDHRDALYTFQAPLDVAKSLPTSVDLREHCPPVYDQGELGSCTGNGTAFILHFDRLKEGLDTPAPPSRLMIYYGAREIEHDTQYDAGAEVRDAFKAAINPGACFEDLWPYDISKFTQRPPQDCYDAAAKDRALVYRPVQQTPQAIRGCLASGFPVVFGFTCYPGLDGNQVAKTGHLPMPGPNEKPVGGHCVALVGYDYGRRYYIVRNSWGDEWGDQGYFYMPFAYVERRDLSSDFWMAQKVG